MMPRVESEEQRNVPAAFDPRIRLYRDPFNEALVFVMSAAGAVAGVPVILLIVGALFGRLGPGVFIVASVLLEWFFIFVVGRPQMSQRQSLGWAGLWGTIAAVFGLLFYYLVVKSL